MVILPPTYFGPIGWWNILNNESNIVFDLYENYIKQTYRNRCVILSCNGPLTLSIPVKKIDGNHTILKNIKIENNQNWQRIHFRAIQSAYKASPYFDYYIDDLIHIWEKKYEFLIDVCFDSINAVGKIINIKPTYQLSEVYIIPEEKNHDFRKEEHFDFQPLDKYYQVFEDRFDFHPNLSILDKIFNNGR